MASTPPRNLIVCCDGTSNEIGANLTNVLKLYRILDKDEHQRVFYDPGVGTVAQLAMWGRLRQKFSEFLGLATGYGLDANILDAYRWLCANYQESDRIFLFGFSRGAYTVRALAGLINMIGLLNEDQLQITGYGLTAYKRAAERDDLPIAWQFQRISEGRDVTIHFMGVWDTVASVIVPRPDRLYLPSLQFLPYTKQNSRVRIARHAVAIDERRAMFRNYNWNPDQKFAARRFGSPDAQQDSKQVWFAGVHADVGGGYPEDESGLAKFPLRWMLAEAEAAGARLSASLRHHLVEGRKLPGGRQTYVEPDAGGLLHRSLKGFWWLLEIIPKRTKWRRWPKRANILGFYFPWAEPRLIREGARIHESVLKRMEKIGAYRPVNLPKDYVIEEDFIPERVPGRRNGSAAMEMEERGYTQQETAALLYAAAEQIAQLEGMRFGEGADLDLRNIAMQSAAKIDARAAGGINSADGRELVHQAEQAFALLAREMVNAREEVYDQARLAQNIIGEQTLDWARRKICPLFPICD